MIIQRKENFPQPSFLRQAAQNLMTDQPLILLTNDDGIDAPGLRALYDAVVPFGRIEIVAPARQRSAVSHAISVYQELLCTRVFDDAGRPWGYALDAMPADCVKLAVARLLDRKPDLVISGINPGANLGCNILYSGTASAAREAAMYGLPALAVSVQLHPAKYPALPNFDAAATYLRRLVPEVLRHGLPIGTLLNINTPNRPPEEIQGVMVSRQGRTFFTDRFELLTGDETTSVFRNVGDSVVRGDSRPPDADDVVVEAGCISVTPLQFDLTHHASRQELSDWLPGMDDPRGSTPSESK